MKKAVSFLLTLVLMLGTLIPVCIASGGGSDYPVIMIEGRGSTTPMYNKDGEQIFPIDTPTEYIVEAVKECLPYLGTGLLTGDLEPWAKKVGEVIAPIYEDVIPDKNGEITDGSGPAHQSGRDTILWGWGNGIDYCFKYDWRRDPLAVADSLQDYILNIKEKTGCEKVSLSGRCYGGSIIEAYLAKYGHEYIDTVVFYCSTIKGGFVTSKAFSGQFDLDPQNIGAYLNESDAADSLIGDPVMTELLKSTLTFLNSFYGLDGTTEFLTKLINEKLYPALAPYILPVSFGAYPVYWAMCDDESYAAARELVYGGQQEEYKEFLEKIDAFHEIQVNIEDMLTQYVSEGMNIAFVEKYNSRFAPLFVDSDLQGDDTVELSKASLGATAARFGDTLSDEYISGVDGKYISSDHIIDASTCLFPEYTWFIKDLPHMNFSKEVDIMMSRICKYDGQATVDTFPEYPRFMKYNSSDDTLFALTDEPVKENKAKGSMLSNFIVAVINWAISIFKFLFGKLSLNTLL